MEKVAEYEDEWGKSLRPPKDRFNIVYFIFMLHGLGMLMSWNIFITIAPQYYVSYWFNGTTYANSLMSVIGVTSQFPGVAVMVLNTIFIVAGLMMLRIVLPLIVNCLLIGLIIFFVILETPSDSNREWFYIVTLVIIMLMNIANGIYQNSIYGIVADFPDDYINSLIIGNNLCGVFTSLMSIVTTLISPDDIELNALLYFSISLAAMLICLFSLVILVRLPYYQYVMTKKQFARDEEEADNPSLWQYIECCKYCWVQLFNNFWVYFISLIIFPAMLSDTPFYKEYPGQKSVFGDELYFAINTYLNFNIFAWIGSSIANYTQFIHRRYLWIFVLLRTLFIPFFMFCNYRPDGIRNWTVLFQSEWFPFFGNTVLALTCGYFSSLATIYTPSGVPPHYQKLSGMLASIFLMLGILCGVVTTPLFAWMVKTW